MLTPETINGFRIIAESNDLASGESHVIGHRPATWGHEYVVGRYVNRERTGWSSGHYTHSLSDALSVFASLTGKVL